MILICVSCQDDLVEEEGNQVDDDMLEATRLADQYLASRSGRYEMSMKAVTVLKFKDGQLYFTTSGSDFLGYEVVTEESITAIAAPGEYLFWFAGEGLSVLDGIEFDEISEMELDDLPEELHDKKMWVTQLSPETTSGEDLKYDILYQSRDNDGVTIRLDPKIKINH